MNSILTRVRASEGTISRFLGLGALLLAMGIAAEGAHAQQSGPQSPSPPPTQQGFEILATPYLWTPWVSVGVQPTRPDLPSPTATVGAGDVVKHLTWVPFMGTLEARSGSWGVFVDYLHAPLKAGINTPHVEFGAATGGLDMNEGTALFLYRAVSDPVQRLDLGVGVRAWGLDGDIAVTRALLPPVSVTHGASWADPILAIRYHRDLGDGFSASLYGDVGGFGAGAKIDWQAIASIDYAVTSQIDLHAGFRSLNFDRNDPKAEFNVHYYGPLIAATFHFGPY